MSASSCSSNEFITEIYGTILDAAKWTDVLAHIVRIAGAEVSNLCLMDPVADRVNSPFMWPTTSELAAALAADPRGGSEMRTLTMLPLWQEDTEVVSTTHYLRHRKTQPPEEPPDSEAMEAWLSSEWAIGARYLEGHTRRPFCLDVLCVLFGDISERRRLDGVARVAVLMPHVAKAVEIARPVLLLKAHFQATLDVLDRFHLGVFIVSDDATVAMRNAAADRVLELADALSLDPGGQLRSRPGPSEPELGTLIASILDRQRKGEFCDATELTVARRSGASPYIVEISPLSQLTVIGQVSGLMVIAIDSDHRRIVSTRGMEALFGLSTAESHVCRLLVEGYSTQEIAETRNVSPVTIKNQVRSLLAKTDNRSRSELIRQALSINLPADLDARAG